MRKQVTQLLMGAMTVLVVAVGWRAVQAVEKSDAPAQESHAQHSSDSGQTKEFTFVAIRYEGSTLWLPSTIIVKKGTKIKIKLVNNIPTDPANHGFSIDEYKIKTVVNRGAPETVEFTADKDGLFDIYCQLHPAHVGGHLLVLK